MYLLSKKVSNHSNVIPTNLVESVKLPSIILLNLLQEKGFLLFHTIAKTKVGL